MKEKGLKRNSLEDGSYFNIHDEFHVLQISSFLCLSENSFFCSFESLSTVANLVIAFVSTKLVFLHPSWSKREDGGFMTAKVSRWWDDITGRWQSIKLMKKSHLFVVIVVATASCPISSLNLTKLTTNERRKRRHKKMKIFSSFIHLWIYYFLFEKNVKFHENLKWKYFVCWLFK